MDYTIFIATFGTFSLAELVDKTQLVTASLAAQHDAPLAVFAGSTLALWSVSLLGIFAGRQLLRFVPLSYIHRAAGFLFIIFGAAIAYQALSSR
jgi:putative Ca2+/H+ antiporter (TMEM165/GDT1 family)